MAKNAYIHIPFCKSKCKYCSFVSFAKLELKKKYIEALLEQISIEYKGEKLETLYFGGGTPSLVSVGKFESIIKLFDFEKDAEITVEVNPDSVDLEFLSGIRNLGVNRISIGSQIFDDEILKQIGRRHNSAQIKDAVKFAKEAGFKNISLDFIYGLPNQSIESFENDLKTAASLGIQHVSLYGLKIDEGCYFYDNMPKNLADLDLQADMYLKAIETLSKEGFEHYEISNFSLAGFNSRHNLNYWEGNEYYGFGCAASGYLDRVRFTNALELEDYIKNPLEKVSKSRLSEQEILEEFIFLGFRKMAGINVFQFNQKFGEDFESKYSSIIKKYSDYLIKTENGYALNVRGVLVSNEILSEFIEL